ncbi:SCO family protein [Cytobacillus purgationiresistens]|uniref:Protein SCO1/2 n=1 Tax=Cytobacillus purgationiresistens TaxID=863449 RepID=A0ABU0AM90_9BACI|nr:SCO family protein [Cytobacillus purgationiresistens]MDQ0271999.1 protein SCO1/2 [Cytobacillus purgationiresistens]
MKRTIWMIMIGFTLLVLSACGQEEAIENPLNYDIGDFTFTDQNNEPLSLKDLEGKVWLADFIFTSCEDVCMPMTANMNRLQAMAKEEGIENIEFVSFSVDPTVDTPEVLLEYGEQYNADFSNWHFLTGYDQAEIEKFAADSFKALVKKPQSGDQVIHGTKYYLVDKEGTVMKDYDGVSEVPFEQIIEDMKKLQ